MLVHIIHVFSPYSAEGIFLCLQFDQTTPVSIGFPLHMATSIRGEKEASVGSALEG
jgi:hypothetical protein